MDQREQLVEHLKLIQQVINRLGHDSFLVKGWSMTILAAGIIFVARTGTQHPWMLLAFIVPTIGFWVLDGYFLWQERLFRYVYDDVRGRDSTDFRMNPTAHQGKPASSWLSAMSSATLRWFYGMEVLFVVVVVCILLLN